MQTKTTNLEFTTTSTQPVVSLSGETDIKTAEQPPVSPQSVAMPAEETRKVCETCGNEYDKAFEVVMNGKSHTFDCFECAIQALAPACAHCGCTVIGHGVERDGDLFCCDHCARHTSPIPPQAGS